MEDVVDDGQVVEGELVRGDDDKVVLKRELGKESMVE